MESSKRVSRLIKNAVSKNENVLTAGDFNYKEINWIHDYAPPEKEHLTHFIETLHECYTVLIYSPETTVKTITVLPYMA